MSKKPNDGGPAFPQTTPFGSSGGMTLRDWFAGQQNVDIVKIYGWPLLEVLAGQPPEGNCQTNPLGWFEWHNRLQAKLRYAMADAMIAEREKGKNE